MFEVPDLKQWIEKNSGKIRRANLSENHNKYRDFFSRQVNTAGKMV